MGLIVVASASFSVSVDSPVESPGVPPTPLAISSSGKITSEGKVASLKSDMEGQAPVAGIAYVNPPYLGGILMWDGVLSGSQESGKVTKDSTGVTVFDTPSGTAEFTIVTPAIDPSIPKPDPKGVGGKYPGTWTLASAGQTKFDTTE